MNPVTSARLLLVLAAVLWSLGSLFVRFLREPTALGLHDPPLTPLQIAFFRGLFGGAVLLTMVRRIDVTFRPLMGAMVLTFTVMCGLYMSALSLGPAANAIFLQNTAPVWVYLFAVYALGEAASRRGWQAVLLGGLGAVVIVAGNWPHDLPPDEQQTQVLILLMGVGSGLWYAGVVLFLRVLRNESPAWLVSLNLLGTSATLGVYVMLRYGVGGFVDWVTAPTMGQLALLAVFGVVQMAMPYWLFARGLRHVSPHEAGIITLLEPLLNPLWAYLITPDKDTPTPAMWLGGALILAALVWRYVPDRRAVP
ncbi:DMT family transporter [Urbifossiella limnaea]|uniref:EamA-like transporter family protein n=1 Tax=Urbifossiella limnaea TaxID=2528023 RepID=A0A517XUD1_9BACT|nr:DMT family transporter [Urbifossiella limnaea]QDU21121.1 EamA-like transporter family protein [Urbifossiella limnaea]